MSGINVLLLLTPPQTLTQSTQRSLLGTLYSYAYVL